jgi:predicted phosphoribosyltransferase
MKKLFLAAVLLMMALPVYAKKSCEELKSEVDAMMQAKCAMLKK